MQAHGSHQSSAEFEFILVRTLILQPHEKSVRRVRLQSGRLKRLTVPVCLSQVPLGLPRPELFVIRSVGSESGRYLAVNPIAARTARHKFDPIGFREFTWVRDLTADPIVNKMVFENRITGQHFGECELNAEESKALEKWTEHLGGQFELTVEASFSITIKRPGQSVCLFSLLPTINQVPSLDLDMILLTNMSNVGQLDFISQIYNVFCMAWKKERFDSLGLLVMLSRHKEQTEVLDSHLLSVSQTLIRSKVKTLTALRDYVLYPLETLELLESCPNHLQEVQLKIAKTLQEWTQVLDADRPLTASAVTRVLSTELPDCVPLDTSWWRQLQSLISSVGEKRLHYWIVGEALSVPNIHATIRPIHPRTGLWDSLNSAGRTVDDLQSRGLNIWLRCPKPSWPKIPFRSSVIKPNKKVDQISQFKVTGYPNLKLCTEYPAAAIDNSPSLLFNAGEFYLGFYPPNKFYRLDISSYEYKISVPSSQQNMIVLTGVSLRNRFAWYVLALRGYLYTHTRENQTHAPTEGKFDCMSGEFILESSLGMEEDPKVRVSQLTSSRTHLYLLGIYKNERAVLRVPILPNNPPCEVHLLEPTSPDP